MHILSSKELLLLKHKWNRAIDGYKRNLILKNNTPFISCISKINNVLTDNAEDLDVATPMYNEFEYSKNYRKTSRKWNYYKDELVDPIKKSESFKYKTGLTEKTAFNGDRKEVEYAVPLKYLSNI